MRQLKKWLFVGPLLLFHSPEMTAQSAHLFLIEPTISIEGEAKKGMDYFFQLSGESRLTETEVGDEFYANGVRHIELQVGLAYGFTTDLSGSASFVTRFRNPLEGQLSTELRPIQQVTLAKYIGKYRFRQRLRADERFRQDSPGDGYDFDLRLRYRFSVDFPLEGDRLDDKEFYLNTNAEFLYTPTEANAFFYKEYRGYLGLGFQFDASHTLELGSALETARISRELGRENNWVLKIVWAVSI